jgi:prolyl-tRNA synthetase
MFSKTEKNPKEYDSANATLLIKGGFIDQVMSGVYTFLPLGNRVLQKIENIVREEMDKIGVELLMPAMTPKEYWKETGRLEDIDILFKAIGANEDSRRLNDSEYILCPTHEEVVTPLAKKFRGSYKDFPFAVYQIQTKFRNEARPKSGLLRAREFRMKDLYSFHTSVEDLQKYYEKAKEAYWRVFERLEIKEDTVVAAASGGTFTTDFSHEFQTKCETGEDLIFQVPSTGEAFNREVAPSKATEKKQDEDQKELEYREEPGIIGVKQLCDAFGISADQSVKTLLFETNLEDQPIVVAALRGDYDINEYKLMKIVGCSKMRLASEENVRKITGAEIGYAGILDLPENIPQYFDESIEGLVNFECGANKTNFHVLNANWGRDVEKPEKFYDIKMAKEGDLFGETMEVYDTFQASEVGNIFPLHTKFADSLNYSYTNDQGEEKPVIMGCYGLGTSRVLGVLVEKLHDENGIVWPTSVAPFHTHLIHIGDSNSQKAEGIYNELQEQGVEVLWDEREDVSIGEKFADADLIGCPFRVVVSNKTLEQNSVEIKRRSSEETKLVSVDELSLYIKGNI